MVGVGFRLFCPVYFSRLPSWLLQLVCHAPFNVENLKLRWDHSSNFTKSLGINFQSSEFGKFLRSWASSGNQIFSFDHQWEGSTKLMESFGLAIDSGWIQLVISSCSHLAPSKSILPLIQLRKLFMQSKDQWYIHYFWAHFRIWLWGDYRTHLQCISILTLIDYPEQYPGSINQYQAPFFHHFEHLKGLDVIGKTRSFQLLSKVHHNKCSITWVFLWGNVAIVWNKLLFS